MKLINSSCLCKASSLTNNSLSGQTFVLKENARYFLDMLFYRAFNECICKEKIFHPSMALKTLLATLLSVHLSLKSSLIIKPRLTHYFDVTVFKKHICIFN